MQKKLIALAVAGLISAPVAAQSNVQIYGTIDMGVSYLGSGEALEDGAASPSSRTGIDSGLHTANRIGFRGQEDLGNGLTAFFQYEAGMAGEVGGDNFTQRQTLLGLRGDFGQVSVGRQWNPSRQFLGRIDPFNNDSFGAAESFYSVQNRLDNSIIYTTPNFQGFEVDLAYSSNVSGQEETRLSGQSRGDERWVSIVPTYQNGPLTLGLSYQQSDSGSETDSRFLDTNSTGDGMRQWDIGAAYDFGMVEVSAMYGRLTIDKSLDSDPEVRQWLIGAAMPVSEAGTLKASYVNNRYRNNPNTGDETSRGGKWSLGYDHALSNRTNLYAVYSHVNTNSAGEGFYDAASNAVNTGGRTVGGNAVSYEQAFAVGVRHRF